MEVHCYFSLHFPSNRCIFSCALSIFISSWVKCLFKSFANFSIELFGQFLLSIELFTLTASPFMRFIFCKKFFTVLWHKSVFNRTEVFILNGAHSFFNWIVFVSFSKMSWLYYKASRSGGFYFVLLIYMCCLGYFGFIVSLEIKYCESFNFALLPQHCVDWSRTFCLPT